MLPRALRHFSTVRQTTTDAIKTGAKTRIAAIDEHSATGKVLFDSFRRRHDYLRISLTERCNLRCLYCMPSEGIQLSPSQNILTNEEILRLAKIFTQCGVTKIRLTGGEPTVRKGLDDIIAGLNALRPHGLKTIAMTTNGLALHRRLHQLVDNGLTHINISLDTLDPFKFEFMTRRRGHQAVLQTLSAALQSPKLQSVKLNVVVIKGLNDSEVLQFVEMTRDNPLCVRFIEFMPFSGNKWDQGKMVPSKTLLDQIATHFPNIERMSDECNDTARNWRIPGHQGSIGFISSMSDHFCSTCNRLRITADGQIKVCLFDTKEVSLRDKMRDGATDEELLSIVRHALHDKKEQHPFMDSIDVVDNRPMILIGVPATTKTILSSKRQKGYAISAIRRRHLSNISIKTELTHLDSGGKVTMVDVSDKAITRRTATAAGRIYIPCATYDLLTKDYQTSVGQSMTASRKGDVLTVAHLAAIMGAKKTGDLIPLCHPLSISNVSVKLSLRDSTADHDQRQERQYYVLCEATVNTEGKTGVEMEALTAVSVGLLTIWDMLKSVAGRDMRISDIYVSHKAGGRSGEFTRDL